MCKQVKEKGNILQRTLQRVIGQNQFVGDIRGRGLFRGIEIVKTSLLKNHFLRNLILLIKLKRRH